MRSRSGWLLLALAPLALACGAREPVAARSDATVEAERARVRAFWTAYREACEHRVAGRSDAAIDAFRLALAIDPAHEDSLYGLGSALLDRDRFDEARASFVALARVNPRSSRAHQQIGWLALEPRVGAVDPVRARDAFLAAHDINREETGPLFGLAEAALVAGDDAEASRRVAEILGSNPNSTHARLLQAFLVWREKPERGVAEALTAIEAARGAAPVRAVPSEGDTKRGSAERGATAMRRDLGVVGRTLDALDQATDAAAVGTAFRSLDAELRAAVATGVSGM